MTHLRNEKFRGSAFKWSFRGGIRFRDVLCGKDMRTSTYVYELEETIAHLRRCCARLLTLESVVNYCTRSFAPSFILDSPRSTFLGPVNSASLDLLFTKTARFTLLDATFTQIIEYFLRSSPFVLGWQCFIPWPSHTKAELWAVTRAKAASDDI